MSKILSQSKNKINFNQWSIDFIDNLMRGNNNDPQCGSCTACCNASKFIRVSKQETHTLSQIPECFKIESPFDQGSFLIPFDDKGSCALFQNGQCKIYDARPLACRSFDCRIFAVTQINPENKVLQNALKLKDWRVEASKENYMRLVKVKQIVRVLKKYQSVLKLSNNRLSESQIALVAICMGTLVGDDELAQLENFESASNLLSLFKTEFEAIL